MNVVVFDKRFGTLQRVRVLPTPMVLEALSRQWRLQDRLLHFKQLHNEHLQSMWKFFANQYMTWSRRPKRAMPESFASRIKPI